MSKLIRLTRNSGIFIWVNIQNLITVDPMQIKTAGAIVRLSNEFLYEVKETPEEIESMLRG